MVLGIVTIALAAWRYNQVFWQIEHGHYLRIDRWSAHDRGSNSAERIKYSTVCVARSRTDANSSSSKAVKPPNVANLEQKQSSVERHIEWLNEQLQELEAEIEQQVQQSHKWRQHQKLLLSVPGVGRVMANCVGTRQSQESGVGGLYAKIVDNSECDAESGQGLESPAGRHKRPKNCTSGLTFKIIAKSPILRDFETGRAFNWRSFLTQLRGATQSIFDMIPTFITSKAQFLSGDDCLTALLDQLARLLPLSGIQVSEAERIFVQVPGDCHLDHSPHRVIDVSCIRF
ncbi:hypothetical protein [Leptolyngbya sp. AN10]|uniref:hypothetical protein n=1 Tax=Leptolyngbya sp. AN10 TaxID=3423365 RepID=UPI003D3125DE